MTQLARHFRSLALASGLILAVAQARAQQAPAKFAQVSARLFRSSQPVDAESFRYYQVRGIHTIIDLRYGDETLQERALAESMGFRYVNIPLNQESKAADYLAAERKFLQVVDDPASGVVVVHCRQGKDRTGLMVALYEVERMERTSSEAVAEWKAFGGFNSVLGDSIQDYFKARFRVSRALVCSELFSI